MSAVDSAAGHRGRADITGHRGSRISRISRIVNQQNQEKQQKAVSRRAQFQIEYGKLTLFAV